jgi:hypothetical protein
MAASVGHRATMCSCIVSFWWRLDAAPLGRKRLVQIDRLVCGSDIDDTLSQTRGVHWCRSSIYSSFIGTAKFKMLVSKSLVIDHVTAAGIRIAMLAMQVRPKRADPSRADDISNPRSTLVPYP